MVNDRRASDLSRGAQPPPPYCFTPSFLAQQPRDAGWGRDMATPPSFGSDCRSMLPFPKSQSPLFGWRTWEPGWGGGRGGVGGSCALDGRNWLLWQEAAPRNVFSAPPQCSASGLVEPRAFLVCDGTLARSVCGGFPVLPWQPAPGCALSWLWLQGGGGVWQGMCSSSPTFPWPLCCQLTWPIRPHDLFWKLFIESAGPGSDKHNSLR